MSPQRMWVEDQITRYFGGEPAALAAARSEIQWFFEDGECRSAVLKLVPVVEPTIAILLWAWTRGTLWSGSRQPAPGMDDERAIAAGIGCRTDTVVCPTALNRDQSTHRGDCTMHVEGRSRPPTTSLDRVGTPGEPSEDCPASRPEIAAPEDGVGQCTGESRLMRGPTGGEWGRRYGRPCRARRRPVQSGCIPPCEWNPHLHRNRRARGRSIKGEKFFLLTNIRPLRAGMMIAFPRQHREHLTAKDVLAAICIVRHGLGRWKPVPGHHPLQLPGAVDAGTTPRGAGS